MRSCTKINKHIGGVNVGELIVHTNTCGNGLIRYNSSPLTLKLTENSLNFTLQAKDITVHDTKESTLMCPNAEKLCLANCTLKRMQATNVKELNLIESRVDKTINTPYLVDVSCSGKGYISLFGGGLQHKINVKNTSKEFKIKLVEANASDTSVGPMLVPDRKV